MAIFASLIVKAGITRQIVTDTLGVGVGIDTSAAGPLAIGGTNATSITATTSTGAITLQTTSTGNINAQAGGALSLSAASTAALVSTQASSGAVNISASGAGGGITVEANSSVVFTTPLVTMSGNLTTLGGNVTMDAPPSGVTLTVNGFAGTFATVITGSHTHTSGFAASILQVHNTANVALSGGIEVFAGQTGGPTTIGGNAFITFNAPDNLSTGAIVQTASGVEDGDTGYLGNTFGTDGAGPFNSDWTDNGNVILIANGYTFATLTASTGATTKLVTFAGNVTVTGTLVAGAFLQNASVNSYYTTTAVPTAGTFAYVSSTQTVSPTDAAAYASSLFVGAVPPGSPAGELIYSGIVTSAAFSAAQTVAPAVGAPVYLDTAANGPGAAGGYLTTTAPSTTGQVVALVGVVSKTATGASGAYFADVQLRPSAPIQL